MKCLLVKNVHLSSCVKFFSQKKLVFNALLLSTANLFLYANNFFFNRKSIFVRKQFFPKKFGLQNLIFCVHNVVLATIMLDFVPFSLYIFSKMLKITIPFEWRVYVCLDQCLII